jgi:gliding motility-associated-like protein
MGTVPVRRISDSSAKCISNYFVSLLVVLVLPLATTAKDKLEITGQKQLTTTLNTAITLHLDDFTVTGPGTDKYPSGFSLEVFNGDNYDFSGTTIIPASGFTGTLKVKIRIVSAKEESKKVDIQINVIPPDNIAPIITGQVALSTKMNTIIEVALTHLTVVDADDTFPAGFTLNVANGANYTVAGTTVTPEENFTGTLTVPVTVSDGRNISNIFQLQIQVYDENVGPSPTGNAPYFKSFSDRPMRFAVGNEALFIGKEIIIDDPDSPELMYAEIRFDQSSFVAGKDLLLVDDAEGINEVFDSNNGILVLLGNAPLSSYQRAINSLRYLFNSDTLPSSVRTKQIIFLLNDGEHASEQKTKTITLQEPIELDIPTVFSPNDDHANDFWIVRSSKDSDNLSFILRVFDKRGVLIYETHQLGESWDGKHNGTPVPADTYFYTIEMKTSGKETQRQGVVTVMR